MRPPGVKHARFIDELYARYGSAEPACDAKSSAALSPVTPDYRCAWMLTFLQKWASGCQVLEEALHLFCSIKLESFC